MIRRMTTSLKVIAFPKVLMLMFLVISMKKKNQPNVNSLITVCVYLVFVHFVQQFMQIEEARFAPFVPCKSFYLTPMHFLFMKAFAGGFPAYVTTLRRTFDAL